MHRAAGCVPMRDRREAKGRLKNTWTPVLKFFFNNTLPRDRTKLNSKQSKPVLDVIAKQSTLSTQPENLFEQDVIST